MDSFLNGIYYGNAVRNWIAALLIILLAIFILRILKRSVAKRLSLISEKTTNKIDDILVDIFNKTKFFFLFVIAVYLGSLILVLPENAGRIINSTAILALIIQSAVWANQFISLWSSNYVREKIDKDAGNATTISALSFITKLVLWAVTTLLILANLGIDITALIAGLGIGGIAVALAVQNVLGDLFASLSIVLDKPFVIGDFIIIGDFMGAVENIGLKTTRLRSLSGEQIIFSNSDLLQSRVRNYKRMFERRILFALGVVYQTPVEKVEAIPSIIRKIIESMDLVRFDRAHFKEYGNFSLNFEVVYYVKSPEYNVYMDIHQAINLEIMRKFKEHGIEFAYPTQTLFIENEVKVKESGMDRT